MGKPAGKRSASMARGRTRTAKRATTVKNFLGKVHSASIPQGTGSAASFAHSASAVRRMDRPTSGPTKNRLTFLRLAALSPEAREQAVTAGLPATLLDEAATKLGLSQRAFLAALRIAQLQRLALDRRVMRYRRTIPIASLGSRNSGTMP